MSPETLIGMELGKGVLQRQLGHGTIGTVYLSEQSQRQVAVKVFLSASLLKSPDREGFLKRLKEEITLGASLEHAHILRILEHGEQQGLVYQVTPYVRGGTLQDRLAASGALPLIQAQRYLEELALALDYAHGRGILHRDVKPDNILFGSDGHLLLADFAVAGVTTEKNFARVRRVVPGMLSYIAPEYVMGKQIDHRADLYSLGAVLYHMVTGSPLFEGAALEEVAMKQVKAVPRAPSELRPDLPQAAGQVLLRALAKRPAERYSNAQDFATAFRLALEAAHLLPAQQQNTNALELLADLAGGTTKPMNRLSSARGGSLFDPKWQAQTLAAKPSEKPDSDQAPHIVAQAPSSPSELLPPKLTGAVPPVQAENNESAGPSKSAALFEPSVQQLAFPDQSPSSFSPTGNARKTAFLGSTQLGNKEQPFIEKQSSFAPEQDRSLPFSFSDQTQQQASTISLSNAPEKPAGTTEELRFASFQQPQVTGMLGELAKTPFIGENTGTGTIKLTEPVKVVQVPVSGQPGHFVTGFLPVQPSAVFNETQTPKRTARITRIVGVLLALIIIIAGAGVFWSTTHNNHSSPLATPRVQQATPDLSASATANAVATVNANLILSDSLSQNIHGWPIGKQGSFAYAFQGGAYDITNNDSTRSAPALLPDKTINGPFVYSLTMEQIKGNEASPNNQFGMILYATIQNKKGKQIDTFYAFEVLNMPGGEYQFWKYDSSKGGTNDWKELWNKKFGHEFRQGSGPSHTNAFRVMASGKSFTFLVNGHKVGTWKDASFSSGAIGMLVNLKGAEVAFSNLLLTYS